MNILYSVKKASSAALLLFCFASSAALAQQTPENNYPLSSGGAAAIPQPPVAYPGSSWGYIPPIGLTTATATIDKSGALYLPYLPWTGQNIALLANYADFFYKLERDNTTSKSTWAFESAQTTSANNLLSQKQDSNMAAVNATTTTQYQQQFTFFPNMAVRAGYAAIPGTDTTTCKEAKCMPSNSQFNADSLLGVTGFTKADREKNIDPLIVFLGNLTEMFTNPGFKSDDTDERRTELLANPDTQNYILGIRTLGSLQSMALSNFNMMAQEREIIPGLGNDIGMTDPRTGDKISDASQLQLEKYLIDRRLNNQKWYDAMNSATSIGIQRETLFVLMEMQRQIYELRMLNERMLATMSTMQMTMIQMSKAQLDAKLSAGAAAAANAAPPQ